MTVRREVFWVEVEIIGRIMGNNNYETPSDAQPSDAQPSDAQPSDEQQTSDVQLYPKKQKGILIMTDNKFFIRIWFLLSNPFRYIFTGKIRY